MKIHESAFYEFGLLPEVCIHSIIEDQYSKMYIPRHSCDCGCSEWIMGTLHIFKPLNELSFPPKIVHRCRDCNEVRLADHIGSDK